MRRIVRLNEDENGPTFRIDIPADRSAGISRMQIFCFDLILTTDSSPRRTVVTVAHARPIAGSGEASRRTRIAEPPYRWTTVGWSAKGSADSCKNFM
jgi:hypothetical protein